MAVSYPVPLRLPEGLHPEQRTFDEGTNLWHACFEVDNSLDNIADALKCSLDEFVPLEDAMARVTTVGTPGQLGYTVRASRGMIRGDQYRVNSYVVNSTSTIVRVGDNHVSWAQTTDINGTPGIGATRVVVTYTWRTSPIGSGLTLVHMVDDTPPPSCCSDVPMQNLFGTLLIAPCCIPIVMWFHKNKKAEQHQRRIQNTKLWLSGHRPSAVTHAVVLLAQPSAAGQGSMAQQQHQPPPAYNERQPLLTSAPSPQGGSISSSAASGAAFCSGCGKKAEPNHTFCAGCGRKV